MVRTARLLGIVFALLLALSSTVLADVPLPPEADGGHEGVHVLVDSTAWPGATCNYQSDYHLHRILTQPPIAFAFDRTRDVDRQNVSWRAEIWTTPNATTTPWSHFANTEWQTRRASDRSNAQFSAIAYAVPPGFEYHRLFVRVVVRWHHKGNIEGRSAMQVHQYRNVTPYPPAYVTGDGCYGSFT
jgi:hypothetical protein